MSEFQCSQGSVATRLRAGGNCDKGFVAIFLLSTEVKEF